MRSLSLSEIGASVGTAALDREVGSQSVRRVSIDSRSVRSGDLFWALEGDRFDGHDFVAAAFQAGAVAAVVRHSFECPGAIGPLVKVQDTRRSFGEFAASYRRSLTANVVGITGSVGKTSTREAIYAVLSQHGPCVRSAKNLNNEIGVPLSLLEIEPEHEWAVIEMGASARGEIARLAEMARPDFGVLTAIGAAHLAGFGSLDGVARAKGELIESLGDRGVAVLNGDDVRVRSIGSAARCEVCWYGTTRPDNCRDADFVLGEAIESDGGTVTFTWSGGPRVRLQAAGRHQVYAALAAVRLGRRVGMTDAAIARGLSNYRPAAMRCQVEQFSGVTVINDAYNASPPSMWAAIEMLEGWPLRGRRVFVCGDMKELGDAERDYHRELGKRIGQSSIEICIAVGPLSREVAAGVWETGKTRSHVVHCESVERATEHLLELVRSGDVVLVKASRAMQLERVISAWRLQTAA